MVPHNQLKSVTSTVYSYLFLLSELSEVSEVPLVVC